MADPVEIPADVLDDPVAINDEVLLGRERERLQVERELRRQLG